MYGKKVKKNAATDFVNMLFTFTYDILKNRLAIYSKHMLSKIQ